MAMITWWYFACALTLVLSEDCPGSKPLNMDDEGGKWYGYKYTPHSYAHGMCSSYLVTEVGDAKYRIEVKFKNPDGKMEDTMYYTYIEDNKRMWWYYPNENIASVPPNNFLVTTQDNDFQFLASCINGTIVSLEVGTRARYPVEAENARVEEALNKIPNKPPLLRVDQNNC